MQNTYSTMLIIDLKTPSAAQKGFTLIELLVAVIIVGILAAIALPNLISQIGKARDTELRNTVGTITRAQHGFHFENSAFANNLSSLGVTITTQYQSTPVLNTNLTTQATVRTNAPNFSTNQTRAYASLITYSSTLADYSSIFCSSRSPSDMIGEPSDTTSCPMGSDSIK